MGGGGGVNCSRWVSISLDDRPRLRIREFNRATARESCSEEIGPPDGS